MSEKGCTVTDLKRSYLTTSGGSMRLLFIICEAGVDARVMALLGRSGVAGYTRFTGATGSGKHGLREGSGVWPGLNSIVRAAMPESIVPEVLDGLNRLEAERNGKLALKVFSVPMDEYL